MATSLGRYFVALLLISMAVILLNFYLIHQDSQNVTIVTIKQWIKRSSDDTNNQKFDFNDIQLRHFNKRDKQSVIFSIRGGELWLGEEQQSFAITESVTTQIESFTSLKKSTKRDFSSFQHIMQKCSLSMGVSLQTLQAKQRLVSEIAKNATILLSSIRQLLPQNRRIGSQKNPCWKTLFSIANATHGDPASVGQEGIEKIALNLSQYITTDRKCLMPKECIHCLPYVFLAGFPKCGTTSLFYALSQHHQIVPPLDKEPQWWARASLGDLSTDYLKARTMIYLQYFESAARQMADKNVFTLDASQTLMIDSIFETMGEQVDYCANVALISKILPDSKFIIAMRDPVESLYSAFYNFHWDYKTWPEEMKANATLYFHNEVEGAITRFNDCLACNEKSIYECDVESDNWGELKTRLGIGIYAIHIRKWMKFFPTENFLFLKTEDFAHDLFGTMKNVTQFIGIQAASKENVTSWFSEQKNSRSASIRNKYRDMLPATRKLLSDFYAPYNKQLVELIKDERFLWPYSHVHDI